MRHIHSTAVSPSSSCTECLLLIDEIVIPGTLDFLKKTKLTPARAKIPPRTTEVMWKQLDASRPTRSLPRASFAGKAHTHPAEAEVKSYSLHESTSEQRATKSSATPVLSSAPTPWTAIQPSFLHGEGGKRAARRRIDRTVGTTKLGFCALAETSQGCMQACHLAVTRHITVEGSSN